MTTSSQVLSAREVDQQVVRMVEGTHGIIFADLFADDGVLGYPFAPPGMPARLDGAAAIRAFHEQVAQATRSLFHIEGVDSTIHETTDPEVVVAEIEHYGTSDVTGGAYRFTALGVIRVRDGAIVSYRDYMDPIALARLAGRTDELVTALAA